MLSIIHLFVTWKLSSKNIHASQIAELISSTHSRNVNLLDKYTQPK